MQGAVRQPTGALVRSHGSAMGIFGTRAPGTQAPPPPPKLTEEHAPPALAMHALPGHVWYAGPFEHAWPHRHPPCKSPVVATSPKAPQTCATDWSSLVPPAITPAPLDGPAVPCRAGRARALAGPAPRE